MPSLHHGAIFIGVFLIVTGGSTAFLASYQSRLQAFSLCCVVLGAVMLILGLFWAMNSKSPAGSSSYAHGDYSGECPHYSFNDYPNFGSNHLAVHMSESQSGFLPRSQRPPCAFHVEEFDYPPMVDHHGGGFTAPPPPAQHPPPWMGPPPPYEEAIKITCSSTNMRRAYSDTHLASEPLFGRSREISFEV